MLCFSELFVFLATAGLYTFDGVDSNFLGLGTFVSLNSRCMTMVNDGTTFATGVSFLCTLEFFVSGVCVMELDGGEVVVNMIILHSNTRQSENGRKKEEKCKWKKTGEKKTFDKYNCKKIEKQVQLTVEVNTWRKDCVCCVYVWEKNERQMRGKRTEINRKTKASEDFEIL